MDVIELSFSFLQMTRCRSSHRRKCSCSQTGPGAPAQQPDPPGPLPPLWAFPQQLAQGPDCFPGQRGEPPDLQVF